MQRTLEKPPVEQLSAIQQDLIIAEQTILEGIRSADKLFEDKSYEQAFFLYKQQLDIINHNRALLLGYSSSHNEDYQEIQMAGIKNLQRLQFACEYRKLACQSALHTIPAVLTKKNCEL